MRLPSWPCLMLPAVFLFAALAGVTAVHADVNSQIVTALVQQGAYLTTDKVPQAHIKPGDLQRIKAQVNAASTGGVDEDIAVTGPLHPGFRNSAQAASNLFNFLDFSGVLILVTPQGVGISSDVLTPSQDEALARRVRPVCVSQSWPDCAILAGKLGEAQARADKDQAFHDAVVTWAIIFAVIAVGVILAAFFLLSRRRRQITDSTELRQAALDTLGRADAAIEEIERAGKELTPDQRAAYDRALGLRDRARLGIRQAAGGRAMVQANEDAAQAVLALQGVQRALGLQPDSNPLDLGEHRCFYCGHTDRPPYVARTITDGRGNSMNIEICALDAARLARGQTPPIATVRAGSMMVPWWAVNTSPWYYAYGGPTWQYWLPFLVGMDIGTWFSGGWQGGGNWGGDGFAGPGVWAGDPGDVGSWDAGAQSGIWGDAGGAGFGGWGDSAGAGVDPGMIDIGGDYGGGADAGTWGDAGGADFGGGGDSGGWS